MLPGGVSSAVPVDIKERRHTNAQMAFTTDATGRAHRYLVAYRSLRLDKQRATVTPAPKIPVTQVPRGSVIYS